MRTRPHFVSYFSLVVADFSVAQTAGMPGFQGLFKVAGGGIRASSRIWKGNER